jgi:hypothetical protein
MYRNNRKGKGRERENFGRNFLSALPLPPFIPLKKSWKFSYLHIYGHINIATVYNRLLGRGVNMNICSGGERKRDDPWEVRSTPLQSPQEKFSTRTLTSPESRAHISGRRTPGSTGVIPLLYNKCGGLTSGKTRGLTSWDVGSDTAISWQLQLFECPANVERETDWPTRIPCLPSQYPHYPLTRHSETEVVGAGQWALCQWALCQWALCHWHCLHKKRMWIYNVSSWIRSRIQNGFSPWIGVPGCLVWWQRKTRVEISRQLLLIGIT